MPPEANPAPSAWQAENEMLREALKHIADTRWWLARGTTPREIACAALERGHGGFDGQHYIVDEAALIQQPELEGEDVF